MINNLFNPSICKVPGKCKQGSFCLDVASKCLDLYENLFQVPYPLPKSDLLAIPDFGAGAMENWGCVTYREAKILVKKRCVVSLYDSEKAQVYFNSFFLPKTKQVT